MAITASTSARNRIFRSDARKSFFESAKNATSTAISWNQGDLLYLDTTAHLIKVVSATATAATFVGIADNTLLNGILVGPYTGLTATNAAEALSPLSGPQFGVEAKLKLKASDAFVTGGKVYLADGQDSQTVSSVDPGDGNFIGFFQSAATTAAAGDEGTILLCGRGQLGVAQI